MSSIDERIVAMSFRASTFIEETKNTVSAIQALKNSLASLKGSEGAFNEIEKSAKDTSSFSGLASGIGSVESSFSALGLLGLGVLSNLANKAINAGLSIAKSLTIDPIKAGLQDYETKINAIQTILANTQAEGTKLPQVTSALNQLNQYANLTVYNFAQMAQNIGTFTAAGVDLNTSVASIKGIANLAALSGSSAEQASTAMYQLSQAIAAGQVKLQDWNSAVNAGIGGKVFQNALETTARATGVNIDAIIKKAGSFRNSLQQGWLTSKILTQTLSTFTGDLSNQQLKALGYTQAEIVAIQKQAKTAVQSATQIRTISQLSAALKDDVGTAWASVWQSIVGDSQTAPKVLTAIFKTMSNGITGPVYALSKLIDEFDKLGGRTDLIYAVTNTFHFLSQVLGIVKSAFNDVFPPVTVDTLVKMAVALLNLSATLGLSGKSATELHNILVGIFSVFKIGIDVVEAVVKTLFGIGAAASSAGPSVLSIASKLGLFLQHLENMLSSGKFLEQFFGVLTADLRGTVSIIASLISGVTHFGTAFPDAGQKILTAGQKIISVFAKIWDAVAQSIDSGNFSAVVSAVNGLLLTRLLVVIKNFFLHFKSGSPTSGLFDSIKESFENLTGALKNMQTAIKAKTLDEIATAVGILTLSMFALSTLNVSDLQRSLTAITIMMVQLGAFTAVLSKLGSGAGFIKMPLIAASLNLLATSIVILSGAVAILSRYSWDQLERGLTAIAILLTELVATSLILSGNVKGIVAAAYAMEIMGAAINILSIAVGRLGKMDLSTLGKGIGSIAAILVIMGSFNKLGGGEKLIATAAAMLIVGTALNVIAKAIGTLGSLSIQTLAKGLVSVAAALVIIAIAMNLMPPDMIITSAAIFVVAEALVVLSKALTTLGNMSWSEIAKSLVELAGALIIMAAAAIVMEASIPGAIAMGIMAGAILLLTPALVAFAQLGWQGIAIALVALAGAFVVIGVAGLLLTPVIPTLIGFGGAIALLGAGLLAAGVGVAVFSIGLTGLAVALTTYGGAYISFIKSIALLLPQLATQLGMAFLAFAKVISTGGPAIISAFVTVLDSLSKAIIKSVPLAVKAFDTMLTAFLEQVNKYSPKIVDTLLHLLLTMIDGIVAYEPKFINAAIQLIVNFLNGIAREISRVENAAANIVIAFINGLVAADLKIAQAGAHAVIVLINGIANEIRTDTPQLRDAALNLGGAIVDGLTLGLASKAANFLNSVKNLASQAISDFGSWIGFNSPAKEFIPAGASIPEGVALGVKKNTGMLTDAVQTAGSKALDTMKSTLTAISAASVSNIEINPVISPVVDLTKARQGFAQLNSLSKSQIIAASASSAVASSSAVSQVDTQPVTTLNFTQNNTSPTTLDATTIYRQTRNQLSIAKGVLSKQ